MIGAWLLAGLLMAPQAGGQSGSAEAQADTTYYCVYYGSMADVSDKKPHPEVLRLVRKALADGQPETWLVQWSGKAAFEALGTDIQFGSVGGSRALQWKDEGNMLRRGFISFSDLVAKNGSKGLWFALDHPSLWQPPGYECETDQRMLTGTSE